MGFSFENSRYGIVVGAGHGIGHALAETLLESFPNLTVYASYRDEAKADALFDSVKKYSDRLKISRVDPTIEQEIEGWSKSFTEVNRIDFLINAVGFLHDELRGPEKSLRDANMQQLLYSFEVNAIPTVLLAKVFKPWFADKSASLFAAVTAKVGSIGDNKSGGWYGYRASKAALNMFLQNIGIEWKRYNCSVLSLHPGTTITELSGPFIKRTSYKLHQPHETATNLIKVIENCDEFAGAQFYSWDGKKLPW